MRERTSETPDDLPAARADLDLVRRALAGEQDALDRFVARMRCVPRILAAKNARLGRPLDDGDLEDLSQETLVAVWRKLGEYNGSASLETWVYSFTYLELMRRLRTHSRAAGRLETFLREQRPPDANVEAPDDVDFERVLRGLERLASDLAEVLRLKHFEDLTFDEIGARLGVSPNTAKTRYYRGLEKLRELLGQRTGGRR